MHVLNTGEGIYNQCDANCNFTEYIIKLLAYTRARTILALGYWVMSNIH